MAIYKSEVEISQPVQEVYLFLSDLNNHQQLMPENVENWSSTKDTAKLNIKNLVKLELEVKQRVENELIKIIPINSLPFKMHLTWELEGLTAEKCRVVYTLNAELNMLMRNMAGGYLQPFVETQTKKLKNNWMD